MRRYEYGCGKRPTSGYTTVDVDETANIRLISPDSVFTPVCRGGEAGEILSVHFVEHLVRPDVLRLLKMWRKMLADGCKLITAFPDMRKIGDLVLAGAAPEAWMMHHIFGATVSDEMQLFYTHKSFWTAGEFIEAAIASGFADAQEVEYSRDKHNKSWTSEVIATK